jgi:hypothetical protein
MAAAGLAVTDAATTDSAPAVSSEDDAEDSVPCSICAGPACVRCPDCDNDEFCMRCMTDIHARPDHGGHRPLPLVAAKNEA